MPVSREGVRPGKFAGWRGRGGKPINTGVAGRGVRGGGLGEESTIAERMEGVGLGKVAGERGGVGATEGTGLEPEDEGTGCPPVPRIGFGPGGTGVAGDGV